MSLAGVPEARRSPMEPALSGSALRSLVEAGIALTSELSLDGLLARLLENAAGLTHARYAALGVIDASGTHLERFVTRGIDPDAERAIGARPRGRGVLGALIHEARPVRLGDLRRDPRPVGFPPQHPPMRSVLAVPIGLRGVAFGNLYLAEKADGQAFSENDEALVSVLAAQAAVAIENVRLYDAATRWSARLESLNEVGDALATETDLDSLLDLVARRLRELLDARLVTVVLPSGLDGLRLAAVAGDDDGELAGLTLERSGSKSDRVLAEGRSERVDALLDDPEVDPVLTRRLGLRSGLWVPLLAHGQVIGVLAAFDRLEGRDRCFGDDDVRLAETFASRAAVAVDLSERVARDALRRVVAAHEVERHRLARALNEETSQALTSILLGLRTLEDVPQARETATALRTTAVRALKDVRRLAVDLRPQALDDFGLAAAIERLAGTWSETTGITVDLAAQLGEERLPADAATALYRIVQEALTNVVKHAHARHVSILLTRHNGNVIAVIEDDGRGFALDEPRTRLGIQAMRERVELLDGRLRIESARGAGTTLSIQVPFR